MKKDSSLINKWKYEVNKRSKYVSRDPDGDSIEDGISNLSNSLNNLKSLNKENVKINITLKFNGVFIKTMKRIKLR